MAAVGIKVPGCEPGLETVAHARPLLVRDGEPCRIAAALLVDAGVEEDAFEAEAEAQRRAAGGRVQCITFPFVAAVTEVLEGITHHQVLDLRGGAGLLQLGRQMDVANLNRAMFRGNAQVCADSGGAAAFLEQGEEERIAAGGVILEAAAPLADIRWGIGGQVSETGDTGSGTERGIESVRVLRGVERLNSGVAAAEAAGLGQRAPLPVRQGAAGWL